MGRMPYFVSVDDLHDAADCLKEACETLEMLSEKKIIEEDGFKELIELIMASHNDMRLMETELFEGTSTQAINNVLSITSLWFNSSIEASVTFKSN